MNKKIPLILLVLMSSIFIIFNIFKNTYAYDYKDYDYTLFNKDNDNELTEDIKKYISDIDYIIYNNSDFSMYDTLHDNYEFMVNFAIDYICMHKDKYEDKIVLLEPYRYMDKHHNNKVTNEYIDINTIYDITNKYFERKDFIILNNNVNLIDKYISLSNTTKNKMYLEIDSVSITKNKSEVTAVIKYKNDSETDYIYTFKINNNILKIYNVEVR